MPNLRYICRQLEPYLTSPVDLDALPCVSPHRLELLAGQDRLSADCFYVGEAGAVRETLSGAEVEGGVLLFAAGAEGPILPPEEIPPQVTLVSARCPLAQLCNLITGLLYQDRQWLFRFLHLSDEASGRHAILEETARLSGCPVLLTNEAGTILDGARLPESCLARRAPDGKLDGETMASLLAQGNTRCAYGSVPVHEGKGILYLHRILHGDKTIGILLMEAPAGRGDLDFEGLLTCAMKALRRELLAPGSSPREQEEEFAPFLREVLEQRVTEALEIKEALERFPHPVLPFARVIVLTFAGSGAEALPYRYMITQLQELFPDCNMAVYEGDIVVVSTRAERTFQLALDEDRLTTLLARYDGYAGVSNGTRNFGMLRSVYLLAKRAILLARELRRRPGERVFLYEDYGMYSIIDMCVQRFVELHGHDDILYLVHPAIVHLTRYDRKHNNGLRDVLFYYLLNDRNLVKTAAATYMHRNTVINKINRIMELVDIDLEDGQLRQRLMFSCQVIRYYEKIMNREMKL